MLEYGDIVWDNCSIENRKDIEAVQLEAARIITGATKYSNIEKLYEEIGWETLDMRRKYHKLSLYYKMFYKLTPDYLSNIIPNQRRSSSTYSLRNAENVEHIYSRTSLYKDSFVPSTTRQWNNLPVHIRNATSYNSFQKLIRRSRPNVPTFYTNLQTDRHGQIHHTRLRLGCSSLNHDLSRRGLIESPLCSCGSVETAQHYLLECPNYAPYRIQYINNSPCALTVKNLLFGQNDANDQTNNIIFQKVQQFILATKRFTA